MINYTNLQSTANRLITDNGQECTLTKLTDGTFDGVLGAYSGQTSTDYTVNAVISEYKDSMIDGTMIKAGDKMACIYSTTAPAIDDVLTVGTVDHKIVNVKTCSPAGTVVMYKAQVRV